MKNPQVGERVRNKGGLGEEGVITAILPDQSVTVLWLYQDSHEVTYQVELKRLRRVKTQRVCPECGHVSK